MDDDIMVGALFDGRDGDLDPDAYEDDMDTDPYAFAVSSEGSAFDALADLLEVLAAARRLWEARCSAMNHGGDEPGTLSFGRTEAKEAFYAACREAWGTDFHRKPTVLR